VAGEIPCNSIRCCGLTFPNALGVAAGFDKDVQVTPGLALLGFGHIEIGTITPRPQIGNPKPRIFRLPADKALINRMGFPNVGAQSAVARLRAFAQENRQYVIGVSLGKQKETALVDAAEDYLKVLHATYRYGDYFVVNVSSPNTPELRKLQGSQYLAELLRTLMNSSVALAHEFQVTRRPLLVKIAPDLSRLELDDILQTIIDERIDGLIATNTTIQRAGLMDANQSERGGLSGAPLAQTSTTMIRHIAQRTEGKLPIIGVGGINTARDARDKLEAGATLVQLYTSLVYQGPGIAGRILRGLDR
jgi:dihydroorotate dehydrogenase